MKHVLMAASASLAALTAVFAPGPLRAEIVKTSDNGFVTRDVAHVEADLKETWLTLISPEQWWSSQHTWSADAANLRLTPQAGGCFCEKIPEVDEPDRFTLEGSVEHMRVIQAYPESALRMVGALGPLQSEPVTGVLTIALSAVEVEGVTATRIVWEYNVGGSMRYEIPVISKAVDGVMSLQLEELAQKLGKIAVPEEPAQAEPEEAAPGESAIVIEAQDTLTKGAADKAPPPAKETTPKGPTVEEAFGDFISDKSGG
ncbi:MAG: SRPBCC family protein [Pseudomonadota bacterium]